MPSGPAAGPRGVSAARNYSSSSSASIPKGSCRTVCRCCQRRVGARRRHWLRRESLQLCLPGRSDVASSPVRFRASRPAYAEPPTPSLREHPHLQSASIGPFFRSLSHPQHWPATAVARKVREVLDRRLATSDSRLNRGFVLAFIDRPIQLVSTLCTSTG
jgi:hypothetical protein